jgi:hypothetical protein
MPIAFIILPIFALILMGWAARFAGWKTPMPSGAALSG